VSRITVIGGTGYAGAAIVEQAATRGHQVTALSRTAPQSPVPNVEYVAGDATDEPTLASVIDGAEVVVSALAPRGPLAAIFRDVNRTIARLADEGGARLFVVGGFSSLRPAPGADRFVTDLSHTPAEIHDEVRAGAALVVEDLPATPESLDWVFVSPPLGFGAYAPREPIGSYELGNDVAVEPETGGAISVTDYALGFVDLIENGDHHRTHVNVGNPA
jgi:putative NADH-flavin reductase